ncbi:hypothetical protein DID75_01835 [Candidatus Marinamargulisbacteria bacterium SCGC AG-410-N11]|nr:hypothetical protein DID75_01835 [Candidatus Marinamargulisbacteria bacterium SCGC AG-410-N11]
MNNFKLNVLNKFYWGIFLLGVIMMSQLYAFDDYGEIGDPGVKVSTNAMRAFRVHYTNYMFYTINVHTPGYIETGVYNTRNKSGRIDFKPFFRWRAGPVIETGRDLDFYIDAMSKGFFVIKLPTTLAYTRDGRFRIDGQGRLVTLAGNYPVMGDAGEIFLDPSADIAVSRSGMIFMNGNAVDKMKIAVFKRYSDIQDKNVQSINGAFFTLVREVETIEGPEHYAVVQYHLEQNNVLKAITGDILVAKNAFDASTKAAHMLNKSISTVSTLVSP